MFKDRDPQGDTEIDSNINGRQFGLAFAFINNTLSDPSINNAGTVAFSGTPFISFNSPSQSGIYTTSSSGGELNPVLLENSTLNGFDHPNINDQGKIAFSGQNNGVAGIFTIDNNGSLSTITDASGSFTSFGNLSLNNQGTVAFEAGLDTGGNGIFIGPDPVADKVIATGDSLLGSTVTNVDFLPGGLDSSGEVAFFAQLADGTTGIFRADPQSEDHSGQGAFFAQLTGGDGNFCANSGSFPEPTHSV